MGSAVSRSLLVSTVLVTILSGSTWVYANDPACGVYLPITLVHAPTEISVGEGLSGRFTFKDLDKKAGEPPAADVTKMDYVLIDCCTLVPEYYYENHDDPPQDGTPELATWTAERAGQYYVIVTADDRPNCADDDPVSFMFHLTIKDTHDCLLCDFRDRYIAPDSSGSSGTGFGPDGILFSLPLGTVAEGKSAGSLYIGDQIKDPNLPNPRGLKISAKADGVEIITKSPDPNDPNDPNDTFEPEYLRQILTPQMLVDITDPDDPNYDTTYEVKFYPLDAVGSPDEDGVYALSGSPFRKWVFEDPNDPNDADAVLDITEYVSSGAQLVERRWHRHERTGTRDWEVTTKDPNDSVVQTQSIDWDLTSSPRTRTYTIEDDSSNELYELYEEYSSYRWGNDPNDPNDPNYSVIWRRTKKQVGTTGSTLLTTTWTYTDPNDPNTYGLLMPIKVTNPDGSWTARKYDVNLPTDPNDPNYPVGAMTYDWVYGFKDTAYSATYDVDDTNVRGLRQIYTYDSGRHEIDEAIEWVDGDVVRKSEFSYEDPNDPNDPNYPTRRVTELKHMSSGASPSKLEYEFQYWRGDRERLHYQHYASGLAVHYGYSTSVEWAPDPNDPNDPDIPGSIDADPNVATGHTYRETTWGYHNGTATLSLLAGKSARQKVILDPGGQPAYQEDWVYTTGSVWKLVSWKEWTYDEQNRQTRIDYSDGTYETRSYPSCCSRKVTDRTGVETTYTADVLGRVETVTREEVDTQGYDTQAEIETSYDYSTPHEIEVTVTGGSLSLTTTKEYYGNGRLKSITSDNETLKTMFEYGTATGGGMKVTTYRDYPPTAQSGTSGERDQIVEYYRDGQVKSVTGGAVVSTYYEYGSDPNDDDLGAYVRVRTGGLSSVRKQTTYYDLLGNVAETESPGWQSSGTGTLTTTYTYDTTTGLLESVSPPGQADTCYEYDSMGNVTRSGLDVGGDGDLDLASSDRVTDSKSEYQWISSKPWRVSSTTVYPTAGSSNNVTVSEHRTQLADFATNVIGYSESEDALGNVTKSTTELNRTNHLLTRTVHSPGTASTDVDEQIYHAGRLVKSTDHTGLETSAEYDDLGRRVSFTNSRGKKSSTVYDSNGRVSETYAVGDPNDPNNTPTEYGYYAATDSSTGAYPGRLKYIKNELGKYSRFGYDGMGRSAYTWGDVPYPTSTTYDTYGQRYTLTTYRGDPNDPNSAWTDATWPGGGTGDVTTWSYHAGTGLLEELTYDDQTSVEYAYTSNNQLDERTWARGTETNYVYDANTGQVLYVNPEYNDPNDPNIVTGSDIAYTYDRLGRLDEVTDAAGTREFAYDPNSLALLTEEFTAGDFDNKIITHVYQTGDPNDPNDVAGRFSGLKVGTSADDDAYYASTYRYDNYARVQRVTGPGLHSGKNLSGVEYTYEPNTPWVDQIRFRGDGGPGAPWAFSNRSFDADRPWLTSMSVNLGNPLYTYDLLAEYQYNYDDLGRRDCIDRSGPAFDATYYEELTYNARNELIDVATYGSGSDCASGTEDPNRAYEFTYDAIGNRGTYVRQGLPSGSYQANELNQLTRWDRTGSNTPAALEFEYDLDGNLTETWLAGDMDCDGEVGFSDINTFTAAVTWTGTEAEWEAQYGCPRIHADTDGNGSVGFEDVNPFVDLTTYGNAGGVARTYVWDSENRLIEVRPTNPDPNDIKVTYAYDYRGRWFERKRYVRDANDVQWDLTEHRKFVYDGERLLLELVVDPNEPNDPDSDTVAMKYTWGLDLLSQFSGGATVRGSGGGIGALLAVWDADDPNGVHAVLHDANGNVVEVLSPATDPNDPNTAIVAHYEYDVYGNRTNPLDPNDPNDTEFEQPFRYASKWRDPDTGLVDFGRRWYFADHGRWLNRDPIGTAGGVNIYAYVLNSPANQIDPLGLAWLPCPYADGCPPLYGASPFCPSDTGGGGGGGGGGNGGGGNSWLGYPPPLDPFRTPEPREPKSDPDCSDCWETCTSADGQAALGSDEGGVICRPDGCRCACVNLTKYPPSAPGTAEHVMAKCVLAHEEAHVDQKDDYCTKCEPTGHGRLGRQGTKPGILCGKGVHDEYECEGYDAEIKCLTDALNNGSVSPDSEVARVEQQLVNAITEAFTTHGCDIDISAYAGVLRPAFFDVLRRAHDRWK